LKLTLAQHIAKSREAVAANKAKGNRHAEVLAAMYAQPSRFIEEILQNTEDAYARKGSAEKEHLIRFKLFSDRVEVHHNGKDFDEADLMSVTTFASTTKNKHSDVNQIGKFGIGFKSVFSVTDAPEIHCGNYHYSIQDYEVLEDTIEKQPDEGFHTLIILPFKKKQVTACFDAVNNGLKNLNEFSLLFLKKINRIDIYIFNNLYVRLERSISEIHNKFQTISLSKTLSGEVCNEEAVNYILFSKQPSSGKQQPELAFKFTREAAKIKVEPVNEAPVFVYFPTRMNSRLNFILNAPFTTNPLREYVPFDIRIAPENIRILNDAARLFKSALKTLVQMKGYDLELLSIFPLELLKDGGADTAFDSMVYRAFYDVLSDFLKTEPAVPVMNNKLSAADEVLIPHDENIANLLNSADLQTLFQKKYFVDPVINEKHLAQVRDYFSETLHIKTVDARGFGFRLLINTEILQEKKISWLKEFYKYLHRNQHLWDIQHSADYYSLRTTPVILASDNSFKAPFVADNRQGIFLPSGKKSLLPVIHKNLLNDKECLDFFNDLGIREPQPADDVEYNIIPQLASSAVVYGKDFVKYVEKILETSSSVTLSEKKNIIELLKKTSWVYAVAANASDGHSIMKPGETYFYSADLAGYFEGYSEAFLTEPALLKKLDHKFLGAYSLLLEESGVKKLPGIKETGFKLVEIDGFDFFVENITVKRSQAFINMVIHSSSDFFSEYIWDDIRTKKWIYTKNNICESPENINKSDISSLYKLTEAEKNRLSMLLKMKDKREEINNIYIDWVPVVHPDDVSAANETVTDAGQFFKPDMYNLKHLTALQLPVTSSVYAENQVYSDQDLEKIHGWSCRYIKNVLEKENSGSGNVIETFDKADWVVRKIDRMIMYIFVCGKTDIMNSFPLNARQLSGIFRLYLFAESTYIYFVDSAGTNCPVINAVKNPFALFSGGELIFRDKIWVSVH